MNTSYTTVSLISFCYLTGPQNIHKPTVHVFRLYSAYKLICEENQMWWNFSEQESFRVAMSYPSFSCNCKSDNSFRSVSRPVCVGVRFWRYQRLFPFIATDMFFHFFQVGILYGGPHRKHEAQLPFHYFLLNIVFVLWNMP